MNEDIQDILKNSENFDEFYKESAQLIADEIGNDTGRNPYNILEEEVRDKAKEYWDEYIDSTMPF